MLTKGVVVFFNNVQELNKLQIQTNASICSLNGVYTCFMKLTLKWFRLCVYVLIDGTTVKFHRIFYAFLVKTKSDCSSHHRINWRFSFEVLNVQLYSIWCVGAVKKEKTHCDSPRLPIQIKWAIVSAFKMWKNKNIKMLT